MTTTTLELVHRSGGSGSTSLVDLPPELLTAICLCLCRRLRDVIDASLELQYRIELVRDGMIDGDPDCYTLSDAACTAHAPPVAPAPLATTAERLARLRALREAWRTLNWSRCVKIPMPGPCCAYELVGGMFCKTQPIVRRGGGMPGLGGAFGSALGGWPGVFVNANTVNGLVGGANLDGFVQVVVGDQEGDDDDEQGVQDPGEEATHDLLGSRTMSATWLPGTYGRAGRTIVREDLGIPTRDFAIDPSQDLMMLLKGGEDVGLPMVVVFPGVLELHVRTMSTNRKHPEARVPVLCTPVLYPVTSVFVQIVDDVVGMMYCVDPARPRITIWNWKTGRLVVDRPSGNLPPGTWDFSFIHSRALFVTTGDGSGTLELFTFTCDRANVYSGFDLLSPSPSPMHLQSDATSSLTHVATLHLPPVHPSARVLSVSTHTGPFLSGCPPDAPFVSSNESRIHVLTVQYVHLPTLDGPRTRPRVCVFVHHRALARYLEQGAAQVREGAGAMEVPWTEWGWTYARMMPHVGVFQWLRYVHGQRVVMLHPTSKAGKSTLQVLDFNARRAFDDDDTDNKDDTASHQANGDREGNESDDVDPLPGKTTLERVDYPTRIVMPNVFVDIVESGLPYREARRDVEGDYSGVMIDDERLVGLKYPAFLTGDMKEIDVLTM